MPKELIIPSRINWDSVKADALEECVYWLLDSLGAKNIDWRVGGIGGGAADGCRDLECIFNIPEPSGDISPQKWSVEIKGRSKTLSASEIKESVLTAAGRNQIDVHLIVTNQHLSNPTKDWIQDWSNSNPRPKIKYWEKQDLERLVSRNPLVAIRLFPESQSPQGMCEIISTRFWDYVMYCDTPILKKLWEKRGSIEWDVYAKFAVLVSEYANGDITKRPWGSLIASSDDLFTSYVHALSNSLYILLRAGKAGTDTQPVVAGLAHLLIMMIESHDAEMVARVTKNFHKLYEDLQNLPAEVIEYVTEPIINTAFAIIETRCVSDCERIISDIPSVDISLAGDKNTKSWDSFDRPEVEDSELDVDEAESAQTLYIEDLKAKCRVGLDLSEVKHCPFSLSHESEDFEERVRLIQPALRARLGANRRIS